MFLYGVCQMILAKKIMCFEIARTKTKKQYNRKNKKINFQFPYGLWNLCSD